MSLFSPSQTVYAIAIVIHSLKGSNNYGVIVAYFQNFKFSFLKLTGPEKNTFVSLHSAGVGRGGREGAGGSHHKQN